MLHALFAAIDGLCDKHRVEKIETIGDAYVAATGCTASAEDVCVTPTRRERETTSSIPDADTDVWDSESVWDTTSSADDLDFETSPDMKSSIPGLSMWSADSSTADILVSRSRRENAGSIVRIRDSASSVCSGSGSGSGSAVDAAPPAAVGSAVAAAAFGGAGSDAAYAGGQGQTQRGTRAGGGQLRAYGDSRVCRLARMALDVQDLMAGYKAPDGGRPSQILLATS